MQAPPELIPLPAAVLRRWSTADVDALTAAARASWSHLRPWLPWAQQCPSRESIAAFLSLSGEKWEHGEAYEYGLFEPTGRAVLGSCGLMRRVGPGGLEIGYWLHVAHTGRGLMTAAVAALTDAGFALPDVDHVEIHCDAANARSAAVPARLGYRHVRTEPDEPEAPAEQGSGMVWRVTAAEWTAR